VYRFDHVISFDCWGPDYWFCVDAVCHGSELAFEFDVFSFVVDGEMVTFEPTEDEKALTTDMTHLWTNFITNGDPNKGLSTPTKVMPLYQEKLDELLVLEEPEVGVKAHQREVYCDFWDRVGYYY
jgi:acetylcholinesterase/cholinesterase